MPSHSKCRRANAPSHVTGSAPPPKVTTSRYAPSGRSGTFIDTPARETGVLPSAWASSAPSAETTAARHDVASAGAAGTANRTTPCEG